MARAAIARTAAVGIAVLLVVRSAARRSRPKRKISRGGQRRQRVQRRHRRQRRRSRRSAASPSACASSARSTSTSTARHPRGRSARTLKANAQAIKGTRTGRRSRSRATPTSAAARSTTSRSASAARTRRSSTSSTSACRRRADHGELRRELARGAGPRRIRLALEPPRRLHGRATEPRLIFEPAPWPAAPAPASARLGSARDLTRSSGR